MGGKEKDAGTVSALHNEKISSRTGESEGALGRLVTLKNPVTMDILEKRVKEHLKLSQSMYRGFTCQ